MNKLICLFFLIVLISASLVPCCSNDNGTETGVAHAPHEQEEEEGNCSPFSSCPGCVVSVEISDNQPPEMPFKQVIKHNPSIQILRSTSFLPGFWQPPRA